MNNKRRYAPRKPSRSGHDKGRQNRPGSSPAPTPVRRKPVRNLMSIEEFAAQNSENEPTPLHVPIVNTGSPTDQVKGPEQDKPVRSGRKRRDRKGRPQVRDGRPEDRKQKNGKEKRDDEPQKDRKRKSQAQPKLKPQQKTQPHPRQKQRQQKVERKPVPRLVPRPVQKAERPSEERENLDRGTVFTSLIPPLQLALIDAGYVKPTPIQEQSIPHLLEGRDILGCAQTGTGKTAAFTLPILQYLDRNKKRSVKGRPRVLVLAPTRELAAQIDESIRTYGCHLKVFHTVIFGGVSQVPQVKSLQRGMDIVVATPGRLLDLMQQGHLSLQDVEVFVLDEADRMLDMGFIHDIRKVIAQLPDKRHSLFFSATLSEEVLGLARTLVRNPVEVTITPDQPTVEKIEQKLMYVGKKDKIKLLVKLLQDEGLDKVIVFTRMKFMANRVAQRLNAAGISAAPIHGNKSQTARTEALDAFRADRVRVLVATDIAARGIDVENITHVVNYDLPNEPETYVHRIGRTARAGAEGDAVSFCSGEEMGYLRDIERLIRQKIPVDTDHPFHVVEKETKPEAPGSRRRGSFKQGGPRPRPRPGSRRKD